VPELTVAENILLGRAPRKYTLGLHRIDWPTTFATAQRVLDELEVGIDARQQVRELGVAQQQVVEIAKAMSFEPSVLMLDEPTSALSQHETQHLFRLVRQLAARGVAILYITHRLQELKQIADTLTVLRDGKLIGVRSMTDATPRAIVDMMFGQVEQKQRPADLIPSRQPLLEVRGLSRAGEFSDISFTLHRGEVLGIAGMLGSGRTELLRAIFGAEKADDGEIVLEGEPIVPTSPAQMRDAGVALVPESRKEQGLVLGLGTRPNFFLASLSDMARHGVSSRSRERNRAMELVRDLAIKVPDIEAPVATLSGGNQQKVVVGKWLNSRPRVVLFDEPTRGIDIVAKQQIFDLVWDLARKGLACIIVSSELEELVEVCHRILILKEGRLVEEVRPEDVTANELWVRCMSA
jgi:ABC-type sugar transport system ATPase subunit